MIESIKLRNWKSFDKLEFKPENINIIIGANASGKSNFLDALELIQKRINNASEKEIDEIRGGRKYFTQFGEEDFELELKNEREGRMYLPIDSLRNKKIREEMLIKIKKMMKKNRIDYIENTLEISPLFIKEKIIILDPIPRLIRGETSTKEEILKKDCRNLIGFIANHEKREEIEKEVLKYLKQLTETEIVNIQFKNLGENEEYSQLYVTELINGEEVTLHSDIISDGTLRFIAIISTLLTQEEGSLMAIEEIDNGIAPSKTKLLFNIIDELSLEKKVDVILTTHNTSLMNYISKELFEFVYFAHRKENGCSTIKRVRDLPRVSKLMSYGEIGELMENNRIIEFTDGSDSNGED